MDLSFNEARWAVLSPSERPRAHITTPTPSRARAWAIARPIPRLAPVTIAHFPRNDCRSILPPYFTGFRNPHWNEALGFTLP